MKVKHVKELNKVEVHIETNEQYIQDYHIHMIKKNDILGLAKMDCYLVDEKSKFVYQTSNMTSLKNRFDKHKLRYNEIKEIVLELIDVVKELRGYLLNPDYIVLDPNLIYFHNNSWMFLYLPVKRSSINKSFHALTEYFVRTLDYNEEEGILFASFLHKETLQDNFNIEMVLDSYKKHVEREVVDKQNQGEVKEIESLEDWEKTPIGNHGRDGIKDYNNNFDNINMEWGNIGRRKANTNRERGNKAKEKRHYFENVRKRFKKEPWGEWDDLIIE